MAAKFLKTLRIAEKFNDFLQLILGFLDSGDVLESHLVFIPTHHPSLGLPEAQCAPPCTADLLPKQEIQH